MIINRATRQILSKTNHINPTPSVTNAAEKASTTQSFVQKELQRQKNKTTDDSVSTTSLNTFKFAPTKQVRSFFTSALLASGVAVTATGASSGEKEEEESALYSLSPLDNAGKPYPLSQLKGKMILFVNVACKCGLTNSNYKELVELHKQYGDKVTILAFPCNQFGGQEPGSNEEIANYVKSKFGAEFQIMDKIEVNGPRTSPVYKYLKEQSGDDSDITWNFGKFLVNSQGQVVRRYSPKDSPKSIEKDIQFLMGQSKL
ncbi:hypothetical protein PROFUN_06246 [Planoprotostelium fungivorum]|uniref:Glutathione peroxidase n=1 Tax=Planoprotostelium fungivorum TaxID=1890364 RepID=A0A2P6NE46_9EUKA|nr:hypothetical protein PROFUN_06246 [Planoprotostelium fungivorum]